MDRRNALLTMSGLIAASSLAVVPSRRVLAQSAMTYTDLSPARYKSATLDIGTFSKQTSQLALSRATHPMVKQFAQFEFQEQTAMAQVLTDQTNPPPAPIDAQHQALLQQLQAQSGRAFDTAYVAGQIGGHHELLNIQHGFLVSNPNQGDGAHIAILATAVINMHLIMLQELQTQIAS